MENMDGWDVALLAAASYLAVTALVRLMIRRRNQLLDEFRKQMREGKEQQHQQKKPPQRAGQDTKAA